MSEVRASGSAEFRQQAHRLVDWIADYLDTVEQRPVTADVAPGDVLAALPLDPPAAPESFDAVIADLDALIAPALTHWQHPSFFAYFPANNSYASILGELVSAGLGVQGMNWSTAPACTELELRVLDWLVELLGLPAGFRNDSSTGGGVIQGSASEATLVAILAARWRATGGAVNHDGDTSRLVAYVTAQAHSSLEKGLRIAGIGTDRVRVVDHDAHFAMRPDHLAELIAADRAAGLVPFFVCSTHGTTSSMAFDPTAEIAAVAAPAGVWVHVDAAMAGIAAFAAEHRWVNDGLDHADSYCTDAHKWMGMNFDCDLFWTTDRAALLGALSILPEYLRSAAAAAGAAADLRDWQIPLGRRFRSLKLWFGLRLDGAEHYAEMVRRHVALAQSLADTVRADGRLTIVAPHTLNLLCVRVADDAVDSAGGSDAAAADAVTNELIERLNASRELLVTRTVLDGRPVMRLSVGAWTTEQRHVDAAWQQIAATLDDLLT